MMRDKQLLPLRNTSVTERPQKVVNRNGTAKVVHLSSAHNANDPRILHKECQSLAKAGYNVTVIACNHSNDFMCGVKVQAVPRRQSRLARMTLTVWNVYRQALCQAADVYHFHDPELIPAGLLLKLHGKRVIYDVHEDLRLQVSTKGWIPPGLRWLVVRFSTVMDWVAGSVFDGIVTATPKIAARFPRKKTVAVQNFPLLEDVPAKGPPYRERSPNVIYAGVISRMRGVMEMIEAMRRVPPSLGALLTIAGPFDSESVESEIGTLHLTNVDFPGWQTPTAIQEALANARIGLALLHPMSNYMDAVPTKLFEYMSAGLPVIASDFPLWRNIVDNARCGILVNPLDPDSIARAIQLLLEHPAEAEEMGRRGRQVSRELFNWASEQTKLLRLYEHVASRIR